MEFWSNLQVHKWPSSGLLLVYVICLLVMYKNRKHWGKELKSILWFIGLSIALFLCPFFAKIMLSSFLPTYLEYERMSWLLFIGPIIAYTFAEVLSELNSERKRIIMTMIVLCAILLSNVSFFSRGFNVADNLLKIPEDVRQISGAITEDAGCYDKDGNIVLDKDGNQIKPKVLVQEEQDNGLIGNWLYHGIRQYTSAPVLVPLYVSADVYNTEDYALRDYGLMNYEYFVCTNADTLRTQAEEAGFSLLYESDDYLLFKNMRECTVYFVRHGQTYANITNVFAGCGTDVDMTDRGEAQILETGSALSDVAFTNVYTSELSRTKKSADLILSKNKSDISDIQSLRRLDDISWGEIEGWSASQVLSVYPDFDVDAYVGSADDSTFVSPVGAESKATVVYRYSLAMDQIVAETDGNALVVGHSSMIWYLQSMFGDQITEDTLDNAGITVLHYDKGKWSLKGFNMSADEYEEME